MACAMNSSSGRKSPPQGRKWKVAVCGPQRPAQVALGPDFTIGWDSHAADFAMTLGEFYCKGLPAPVMVEIKRDDVVFARVYDIRGKQHFQPARYSGALSLKGLPIVLNPAKHDCHAAAETCCEPAAGLGSEAKINSPYGAAPCRPRKHA